MDQVWRCRVLALMRATALIASLWLAYAVMLALRFAARACAVISNAVIPVIQAVVSDRTGERDRVCGMASVNSAYGLACVIGPLLATVLLGAEGEDRKSTRLNSSH